MCGNGVILNMEPGKVIDLQGALMGDVYRNEQQPQIASVKQVIDTLKDKIQPLSPAQLQVIGYLQYLQGRKLHKGKKPYDSLIKQIGEDAPKVAPPGFFIRVIESLIPRTTHIDGEAAKVIKAEREGK